MPPRLHEIEERLTSVDLPVLRQSLDLAEKCLVREKERGSRGETRATAMLAILGVIAGLTMPQANAVAMSTGNRDGKLFLLISFVACLLFLVRGLFYAMRVIGVARRYQIEPDGMIYSFQELSPVDAMRKEVAAVLWTYLQSIQPNTAKLFWLHRCQRNGVVAVVLLVLFGLAVIVTSNQWFEPSLCTSVVVSVVTAILFFVIDPLAERYGRIWNT